MQVSPSARHIFNIEVERPPVPVMTILHHINVAEKFFS